MRNRIIHNIAVLIIVGVLVMAVSMITYMGASSYGTSSDAEILNDAVETSSSIAELAAASTSKADFIERINKDIGKTSYKKGSYDLKDKSDTITKVIVNAKDRSNGTMLDIDIVTYREDKLIYSLSTEKYISGRKAGDA